MILPSITFSKPTAPSTEGRTIENFYTWIKFLFYSEALITMTTFRLRQNYFPFLALCAFFLLWLLTAVVLFLFIDDARSKSSDFKFQCECHHNANHHNDHSVSNDTIELDGSYYRYLTGELLRDTPFPGVDNYTLYTVDRLGIEPLTGDGVESISPEFGPVYNDVITFRYVKSVNACDEVHPRDTTTTLFVAIISAPENVEKRKYIRNTWMLQFGERDVDVNLVGYAFIVGIAPNASNQKEVDFELNMNEDMILVDMIDTYYNLTLKVTTLLNWLDERCPRVDFVLKVDDDVYVNVRNLAALLPSLSPETKSIYGYQSTSPPLRGE